MKEKGVQVDSSNSAPWQQVRAPPDTHWAALLAWTLLGSVLHGPF